MNIETKFNIGDIVQSLSCREHIFVITSIALESNGIKYVGQNYWSTEDRLRRLVPETEPAPPIAAE